MWKSFHELVFISRYEIASLNEVNAVFDVTLGFERPQFVTNAHWKFILINSYLVVSDEAYAF